MDYIPGRNGGRLRRIPKGQSGNPKGKAKMPDLKEAMARSLGETLAAVIPWLRGTWHPWIHDRLALTPAALGYLALFGALSVGSFTAAPRRTA